MIEVTCYKKLNVKIYFVNFVHLTVLTNLFQLIKTSYYIYIADVLILNTSLINLKNKILTTILFDKKILYIQHKIDFFNLKLLEHI
jgi:hypothetical protein